ncbi:serine hydrolase domain-containing protein [Roseateles violae]|uniref:Serine hydrolase domain-containing protein n=1 Tax=Roseateles violae TaxID=3058042 RepID=A0ABT8DXH5_9BURK|nr:serine hydrolase domain-containing protein [Pelomonas sp. PFR6]MDN3922155.1 serine hydrolase domain-containing protein [Pelomonas sp. PFR6]
MNPLNETADMKLGVQERIDEVLARFDRSDEPGLAIGVASRGKVIYQRAFGLASLELGIANKLSTRFRIASTSKHFACLAVMLLSEEGKVDIDASVRGVIPELPAEAGEPTLRQLMTHTSGLRDFFDVSLLVDGISVKPRGYALEKQLRLGGSNFAPGQKAMYNNGGYQLLSLVVDRVAGMSLEDFVAKRIFEPIGMRNSSWASSDIDIVPGLATLHTPRAEGGWRKGQFPYEDMRAEGGMVSTVDDMLLWLAHLRAETKQVGSAATWQQMTTPSQLASGLEVPYAFGLMPQTYRGLGVIHHGGGVIGGACQMITVPSRELDVVILTNGALVNPMDLAETVIDCVLLDETLEPRAINALAEPFRALIGKTYRSTSSDIVVRFDDLGGGVFASVCNTPLPTMNVDGNLAVPFEKVATGPIVFRTAELKQLAEVAPDELVMTEGCVTETLSLIGDPPTDIPDELVGHYAVPELGTTAEVSLDHGKLKLVVQGLYGHGAYFLQAVGCGAYLCEYAVAFPMRAALRVERNANGVTGFSYSSLRTRGVKFVRS